MIPASGEPRKLVHAIESHNLDHVPGSKTLYSQRETLASGLSGVLGGLKRIAMEYSPGNNIPYISRVAPAPSKRSKQGLTSPPQGSGQRFERSGRTNS